MPLNEYYVLMLNKHAIGDNFADFFQDIHYDMRSYLCYYPDHREEMNRFKDRLSQYAFGIPETDRQTSLLEFINKPPEVIRSTLFDSVN